MIAARNVDVEELLPGHRFDQVGICLPTVGSAARNPCRIQSVSPSHEAGLDDRRTRLADVVDAPLDRNVGLADVGNLDKREESVLSRK